MKARYLYIILLAASFAACEDKMEYYSDPVDRINFMNYSDTRYSFAYEDNAVTTHSFHVIVSTLGRVHDRDRRVRLVQIPSGDDYPQAVPGVHSIPFDDPSLADEYVIPAGRTMATLNVYLKRDPSLKTGEVALRVALLEDDTFSKGFEDRRSSAIYFADFLTQPSAWSGLTATFGPYGPVKHRFMIEAAAPLDFMVDNDFLTQIMGDAGTRNYWKGFFRTALAAENARRAADGEDPLREAARAGEDEGILVTFPN
jgi:hypothetical protein